MKVGDLVLAETHTNAKFLGLVTKVNRGSRPLTGDPIEDIDSMFPYHITFLNNRMPNDWYRADSLEVLNESR